MTKKHKPPKRQLCQQKLRYFPKLSGSREFTAVPYRAGAVNIYSNFTCFTEGTALRDHPPAPPAGSGASRRRRVRAAGAPHCGASRGIPAGALPKTHRNFSRASRPAGPVFSPHPRSPDPQTHPLPRHRGGRTSTQPVARHPAAAAGALRCRRRGRARAGGRVAGAAPGAPRAGFAQRAARRGRGRSEDEEAAAAALPSRHGRQRSRQLRKGSAPAAEPAPPGALCRAERAAPPGGGGTGRPAPGARRESRGAGPRCG